MTATLSRVHWVAVAGGATNRVEEEEEEERLDPQHNSTHGACRVFFLTTGAATATIVEGLEVDNARGQQTQNTMDALLDPITLLQEERRRNRAAIYDRRERVDHRFFVLQVKGSSPKDSASSGTTTTAIIRPCGWSLRLLRVACARNTTPTQWQTYSSRWTKLLSVA
jgi:hypothetical protein